MTTSPFTVLHVCLGNICRSPMAEHLLAHRLAEGFGPAGVGLVRSVSAGTGDWHVGQRMDHMAAAQLRAGGIDPTAFRARTVDVAMIMRADLILVATAEHAARLRALAPGVTDRMFLLRQFARLLPEIDVHALPPSTPDVDAVRERGRALVAAVAALRDTPSTQDDLDDPYGRDEDCFARVARQIADAVTPIADALAGRGRA